MLRGHRVPVHYDEVIYSLCLPTQTVKYTKGETKLISHVWNPNVDYVLKIQIYLYILR